METVQGNLTIPNAHTDAPTVYWNGAQVSPVTVVDARTFMSGGVSRLWVRFAD